MTRKELIEDGWIDKYVLGLTSEQESNEVERLASLYPEVQEQINIARNKVFGKFNRNLTHPALRHSMLTKRRVIFGSALIVGLALVGFAFLWRENFTLKKDYLSQCEKLELEKKKTEKLSSDSKVASERSNFINSNTTKRIKVKGCESSPESEVLVFQCRLSGKMMLQVVELPELPKGNYYQVWAQHENLEDRLIGELNPPIKYDSLYVLDTALNYTTLQISSMDPVSLVSEPVCITAVK